MNDILLDIQNLSHRFRLTKKDWVPAVDRLSLGIRRGEVFGLVGESGSGKSTVARCVMNLYRPTEGKILYQGINTCDRREFAKNKRLLQASRQLIFQDTASSLDPRMTVEDIVTEPLRIHRIRPERGSFREEAAFQLRRVGLDRDCLGQYPPRLSGGMRQRVAIARALATEPQLLVADEPIASLDVSIQAQIINLFRRLQAEHGFTLLFIAHDLAVVRYLCHRVGVLYRGRLVEVAATEELFARPLHPYSQALLSAIPIPDPGRERGRVVKGFDGAGFDGDSTLAEATPGHFVLKSGARGST